MTWIPHIISNPMYYTNSIAGTDVISGVEWKYPIDQISFISHLVLCFDNVGGLPQEMQSWLGQLGSDHVLQVWLPFYSSAEHTQVIHYPWYMWPWDSLQDNLDQELIWRLQWTRRVSPVPVANPNKPLPVVSLLPLASTNFSLDGTRLYLFYSSGSFRWQFWELFFPHN